VVSAGGIAGKVTSVGESFVGLDIGGNVEVQLQRSAVAQVLPKGSLK